RDPDKWYKSAYDTIYQAFPLPVRMMMGIVGLFNSKVRNMARVFRFAKGTIWKEMFGNRFEDKEFAKQRFLDFNADVLANVPKEKLLVMNIQEGWEPLCKFLN